MVPLNLKTKADLREAAVIQRRRMAEEERRRRIFDTKSRLFGVDLPGLSNQIEAKRQAKATEEEMEQRFEEQQQKNMALMDNCEQEFAEERRKNDLEMAEFRAKNQKKEQSRDFDLTDRHALKKSAPARIGDDDKRLSVSGAQVFEGEDLSFGQRKQRQKEEQRKWLLMQMDEKKRKNDEEKLMNFAIMSNIIDLDKRATEMSLQERSDKNNKARLNASFNIHLARENSNKKVADRIAEEKDNLAEIYNCLSSDMLTENPETAKSAFGTNRKIPYMYRGMSSSEVETYRQAQLKQQEKALEKLHAEKEESSKWYKQTMNAFRVQELNHRDTERTKMKTEKDVLKTNKRLAEEQLNAQHELNHELTTNQPSPEFFEQFNTTSR